LIVPSAEPAGSDYPRIQRPPRLVLAAVDLAFAFGRLLTFDAALAGRRFAFLGFAGACFPPDADAPAILPALPLETVLARRST
jgi:hypothetical protein